MKQFLWIAAVAVTAFALSLNAVAQQGGGQRGQGGAQFGGAFGVGGGAVSLAQLFGATNPNAPAGGPGGGANAVNSAELISMLGLTAAETTAVRDAVRPQQRAQGQGGGGQGQLSPAERRTRTDAQWAGVESALGAEKAKKFKEIFFQANVPTVNPNAPAGAPAPVMNLDVYVLGALDLTADQKTRINRITDERDAAARAAMQGGGGGPQQMTPEMRAAAVERNTKASDAIKAVLTDAQKAKMTELTAGAAALKAKLNIGQPRQGQGGARQGQGGARNN